MSTDLLWVLIFSSVGLYVREMTVRGQKALERLAKRMGMTVLPPLEEKKKRGWLICRGRWNPFRLFSRNDPHRYMAESMSKLRLFSRNKEGRKFNYPINTFRYQLSEKFAVRSGVEVRICEYQVVYFPWLIPLYVKMSAQTVMHFRDARLDFPEFAVRPERFRHKVGSKLHLLKDIDFESDGTAVEFSKHYLLNGPDNCEQKIRRLFTDKVLSCFADKDEIWVDGAGDQLVFYRADKALQPREEYFRPFVEEGFEVFDVLSASSGQESWQSNL